MTYGERRGRQNKIILKQKPLRGSNLSRKMVSDAK